MASMGVGLRVTSPAVLEGSVKINGSSRLNITGRVTVPQRSGLVVRAQQSEAPEGARDYSKVCDRARGCCFSRWLVCSGCPCRCCSDQDRPSSTSLRWSSWTDNSDQARDLRLALKERFYLQPLPPTEAVARAKESAKEIVNVKSLIDKKAWPYVRTISVSGLLIFVMTFNTIISAKSKDEKKSLKELTGKLFDTINNLDYAAKKKSTPDAEKYYSETVSTLNDVLAKLG
ncbi:hypothetical protein HID58_041300 [Brassica napus]|uniref:Uncharacterized protein n=1 Tax=Brassica napus TaxID=3708 RepID=A0ABQ8BAF1_BRANA|nr:oxygen-evolving enhancer protein 3-1, chloroplastic-like [Brassica napus]KAH0901797.1 hypothetical protein HID58_041300 [Brassica napus]